MAWTAPRTWVTGEIVTAAMMNTHVRDNELYLYDPPMCKALRTTTQSLTDSTWTPINFDSEWFDNAAMHSTSTNTHRIVIPEAGRYDMKANVEFATNSTGNRLIRIVDDVGTIYGMASLPPQATVAARLSLAIDHPINVGKWVALEAYQASGGALNVVNTNYSPSLSVRRVGAYI